MEGRVALLARDPKAPLRQVYPHPYQFGVRLFAVTGRRYSGLENSDTGSLQSEQLTLPTYAQKRTREMPFPGLKVF